MKKRIAINGMGRMGKLALRAAWGLPDVEIVAINEIAGDANTLSTLIEFDSIQGRWIHPCEAKDNHLLIDGKEILVLEEESLSSLPWQDLAIDIVLECTGAFRQTRSVSEHLQQGAKRVVVSAPVTDGPPNIVVGVNDSAFDLTKETIVTAASCTTNCLAPLVKVLNDRVGITRGLVTTIHNPTNTQTVIDAPHKDPRRARSSQLNLIPTSTNSATAVTMILPELKGKLDSIAVRVPVQNASITDCVFQVERDTTVDEINNIFDEAAQSGPLKDILGIEYRPLVSSDFAGDRRSSIVDGQSTRVTDKRLVKVLAWYDNEWGYANRLVELASQVAQSMP